MFFCHEFLVIFFENALLHPVPITKRTTFCWKVQRKQPARHFLLLVVSQTSCGRNQQDPVEGRTLKFHVDLDPRVEAQQVLPFNYTWK